MSERYQFWLVPTVMVEACLDSSREQQLINVKSPMMEGVKKNETMLVAREHEI